MTVAFSHAGVFVRDLDKMVAFYTRFMGLVVSDRDVARNGEEVAFLTGDPREHHQLVLMTGRPADVPFNTVQQISFRVDSLATLKRLYAGLKDWPVTDLGPISHGNAISSYIRDPEGNRVEMFLDTPWYVTQPLGEKLDLSLPDDEIWRWVEAQARRLPGFKPRAEWEAEMTKRLQASSLPRT
jgi:catechol 2,3-dioxygenase-like lactoylglutathione lyase family enzyme